MKAWGRIVGSALGIPAGLPGVAFGFLVGFLIDKAFENRGRNTRFERFLSRPEDTEVDRTTGVLYLAMGLIAECPGITTWTEEHNRLLLEAGGRPVEDSERSELLSTARTRRGFSYRACLAWARRHMDSDEGRALATLVLLPGLPKEGAGSDRVRVARRISDSFEFSPEERAAIWKEARPLPLDASELLGVGVAAELRELQTAYRLLASQFHPDSLVVLEEAQKQEAAEAFMRIRHAYDILRPMAAAWFSDATTR